ncbi:HAMP domain-containing protein [Alloacidobacterium dinghuense]|uniref:histidine kinase n=1 Tax=Alloacidobacterium dinghuense TaxID=2763107 RepID=A0A7G8BJK3_9BACT|nr:ATP-binding protein [Alloacidobacterium dinghuense]QNI32723.1 HAMP domain-containing protein [Alloacidobacterium dinghuense]
MRSLFLKIFLWFWATAIATGIALIITFVFGPGSVPSRWHSSLTDTARSSGMIALAELERGGVPAASTYIERFERDTQLRACLFDLNGQPIAGKDCGTFADMRSHVTATGASDFAIKYGIVRVALILPGSGAREYIFATELPAGPRAALGVDWAAIALRWGVALLVSGGICYLLTRYLTTPILHLREASQQLAAGDLSTRATEKIARRHDELGALVRDFNVMADRIAELVARQRQLIYDVSHELRSPLARLNVALDLGRRKKGNDPAFDHMERDIERLNEMIGRLLTIARLDTSAIPVEMATVNATELVSQIVHDAGFESQKRNVVVTLKAQEQHFVHANAELLHSAIENVVRNAIHYTADGTTVEVALQREEMDGSCFVSLTIRDYGPGVCESDLGNIFQPFYRVADARDRRSGGAGLGLAIADRVIRSHKGTIRAENAMPHGLQINISLPELLEDNAARFIASVFSPN